MCDAPSLNCSVLLQFPEAPLLSTRQRPCAFNPPGGARPCPPPGGVRGSPARAARRGRGETPPQSSPAERARPAGARVAPSAPRLGPGKGPGSPSRPPGSGILQPRERLFFSLPFFFPFYFFDNSLI